MPGLINEHACGPSGRQLSSSAWYCRAQCQAEQEASLNFRAYAFGVTGPGIPVLGLFWP